VSRQYEEEYYRYFGWPYYWQGDALWGLSGFPILELPSKNSAMSPLVTVGPQPQPADPHLLSTQAVSGYHFRTGDEIIGHVCDFMMDAKSWAIEQLVIKIGHRLSGKEVLIPTNQVDRISYPESTVFAKSTKNAVEHGSAHLLAPVAV